jgi:hypothetical protein
MHPDLVHAIVLATLVKLPDGTKRRLTSKDTARRAKAEDAIAASIVVALAQRR